MDQHYYGLQKRPPIVYEGEWQGKHYKDKGVIVDIVPEKLLHTTYWSSLRGKEDNPENYNHIIYEIEAENAGTRVTISQDNIVSEKKLEQMNQNWSAVLENMKKLLEE